MGVEVLRSPLALAKKKEHRLLALARGLATFKLVNGITREERENID